MNWDFPRSPSTKALSERVRVTYAALERRLVGISLSEQRQRNLHREDIRAQSEVRDPLLVIKKKKLGWAGHIMRRNDGRWTRLVQEWYPIGEKRPVGRPRMRWSDSLKEEISLFDGNHLKTHWSTIAKDRMAWKAVIRDHISDLMESCYERFYKIGGKYVVYWLVNGDMYCEVVVIGSHSNYTPSFELKYLFRGVYKYMWCPLKN
uniref:Uncharacterized protein n=1 Tax=Caenorhabditis japonica TaxID=281687 RepID=A0A8R1EWI9_CAEJA